MKIFENEETIPLITDTHFGIKSFKKDIFETMISFFEKDFFPYCLENNVQNVIHCGDLVNNRTNIDLWIDQSIKERFFDFFENNKINLHIIVGNHDMYFKNIIDFNYLSKNTKNYEFIHIYDKQEKIKIGKYTFLMVPWILDDNFTFSETADFCCGHFETVGFKMSSNKIAEHGMKLKDFKSFNRVFSGHFHLKDEQKNVTYIGTQYQVDWGDFGSTKGFYSIDKDFKVNYIENLSSPKHIKIYYDEKDDIKIYAETKNKKEEINVKEAIEIASKNYCKILYNVNQKQAEFDAFVINMMENSLNSYDIETINQNEIVQEFDIEELKEELNTDADLNNLFPKYVNSVSLGEDIEPDHLINSFEELLKESKEKANK